MMTTINEHLDRYLAQSEAFGRSLSRHSVTPLRSFAAFATAEDQSHVMTEVFLRWKEHSVFKGHQTWFHRLGHVRVLARWLQILEPACAIPPRGLVQGRIRRPTPYIYSEKEIIKIVREASKLPSKNGLRGPTCSTLFGLLSVTGLRLGEALGLDDGDVNTDEGVIDVRHSTKGSERVIPITTCTAEQLTEYKILRDKILGVSTEQVFFRSWKRGQRLGPMTVRYNFARLSQTIGLREKQPDDKCGTDPRWHDLRPTFATRTIIEWLHTGRNPDLEIHKRTNFLGHKHPEDTYWYLEAVPEIMTLTMRQVESIIGSGRDL